MQRTVGFTINDGSQILHRLDIIEGWHLIRADVLQNLPPQSPEDVGIHA